MKDSARYAKIVEWSEEDQCYGGVRICIAFFAERANEDNINYYR